jgi:outer membrane lipoprotein-sorting protein
MLSGVPAAVSSQENGIPKGYDEIALEQDAALAELTASIRHVTTFEANFVQERHLAAFVDVLKSDGRLYFQAPNNLRWETTSPYQAILITSQGKVARFVVEDGRLVKLNLDMEDVFQKISNEIVGMIRGDFQVLLSHYRMFHNKSKERHIILVPRDKELSKIIQRLEFWIHPGDSFVKKVVVRESKDDYLEITFLNPRENVAFPAGLFSLDNPLLVRP